MKRAVGRIPHVRGGLARTGGEADDHAAIGSDVCREAWAAGGAHGGYAFSDAVAMERAGVLRLEVAGGAVVGDGEEVGGEWDGRGGNQGPGRRSSGRARAWKGWRRGDR